MPKDAPPIPSTAQKTAFICHMLEKHRLDIERALEYGSRGLTYDKVCELVLIGKYHFYPLEQSVMICTVAENYDGTKSYIVVIAAGDLDEIKEQNEMLERIAKSYDCVDLQLLGRRGWVKALAPIGWKEDGVIMKRVF